MNKDVIYIDVEDDITAIIDRVKASKEKIVALVPPKRVGVLQSAVNLRLLTRAAKSGGKNVVLITTNKALIALTAGAGIPVAKNLQSKPEVAEIPEEALDDGEDIIDGAQLPVSEHEKLANKANNTSSKADALVGSVNLDDSDDKKKPGKKASKGRKVPNFSAFRKKLVLIIIAILLLIGGLIWAIFFAPRATVIISASTSDVSINDTVSLGEQNNMADGVLAARTETTEREVSVEFEATGEREVGEFATGSVRFFSNDAAALIEGIDIPAGTILTAQGESFETDSSVRLSIPGNREATVSVTAQERGTSANGVSGSVSGAPSGVDSANFVGSTSGGTNETVAVVTAEDVQRASEQLVEQDDQDVESDLRGRFGDNYIVIPDSFTVSRGSAQSNPSVGDESESGNARLTSTVTYALTAVDEEQLDDYLTEALEAQLEDQTTHRVYSSGFEDAEFADFADDSVRISATGQIGPDIDEDDVKEQVAGQRYGEIRDNLVRISGVRDVDVHFPFFWVRTVPENHDRITIEFQLENDEED